ncbi:hypothetical protein LTR37_002895 [Vermiconidia calcicola]|uniref:Uncharacterized protein n=1 Tax=Vermiconidia calcicola TaxID=1690605 RepID=A0ACC3NRN0_9PEZI|nr:hypothetical protein LTR37_002895 [Vermiconidia calcicola]
MFNPYYTGRPRTPASGSKPITIDRQEIIRRIKSGESRPTSPELGRSSSRSSFKKRKSPGPEQTGPSLIPDVRPTSPEVQADNSAAGMQIERPRSALHRGDFREKEGSTSSFERFGDSARDEPVPSLSTSPVAPWHPNFPSAAVRQARQAPQAFNSQAQRPARPRATSSASLASTFIYKPPTSPLVQASRPDTPEPPTRRNSRSPDKSRRHTFSPQTFQRYKPALDYPDSSRGYGNTQPPLLRAERRFPYQAHQPRRSLNSFGSLPQTPAPGSRRPSLSDSPLHHATMIGVLGKGDCKANLRCPPHATVPFPAVFYSYSSGTRAASTADQPSPYVGLVDLENNLPAVNASPDKRRQRLHAALSDEGSRANSRTRGENSASDVQTKRRRRQKQRRRSRSPKAPPGGSYRIPQQGQLQIIIKNPNKTAVKLFLIPYDLSDMEPGQKTFIRQRSYSAGPIIDMPLSSRKNLGTDRPEASLSASDDPNDRPMLRYLVHLHICCPSKGRYYLYKSIRVVFANRVPDGKEKLRNEIQLPEPRYSTYKPGRDSNVGVPANTTTPTDSGWRRSAVINGVNLTQDVTWPQRRRHLAQSLPLSEYNPQFSLPIQPLPHALPTLESRPASRQMSDGMDVDSERSLETRSDGSPMCSPTSTHAESQRLRNMKKLHDPFNFERDRSCEPKPGGRSESLLSRRLKDLAFQAQRNGEDVG